MPNVNVFGRLVGAPSPAQGTNAIPALVLPTNTETEFSNQLGSIAVLNVSGLQYVSGATTAPSYGVNFDGFVFKVRAAFKCSTVGTSTAIIAIYAGTSKSGTKVATITSQSLVTASASGFLEATVIWDAVSTKLSGLQSGIFGTTAVSATAITGQATLATQDKLQFVVTANCGTGSIPTTFVLTEFVAETV